MSMTKERKVIKTDFCTNQSNENDYHLECNIWSARYVLTFQTDLQPPSAGKMNDPAHEGSSFL